MGWLDRIQGELIRTRRRRGALLLAGLLLITVLVSLPQAPTMLQQGRDSGVFSYTARVLLDGGRLYRDAWDNKPPVVYLINALSMAVFGVNLWALWLIQVLSLWITGLLFYGLLLRLYDRPRFALLGAAFFLFQARHFVLTGAGNFTETYALLPQVICLLAGYAFLVRPTRRWGFVLGLAASLAFLTKQNTIGVALVFPFAVLISRHPVVRSPRACAAALAVTILGGLSGLAAAALYLLANGVLSEALYATFVAPSLFHTWVSQGSVPVWETVRGTLTSLGVLVAMGPLAPLAIYGWITVVWRGITHRDWRGWKLPRRDTRPGPLLAALRLRLLHSDRLEVAPAPLMWHPLGAYGASSGVLAGEAEMLRRRPEAGGPSAAQATFGLWVALAFVLDMLLANLSNRGGDVGYAHYYLTPIPSFVLLVMASLAQLAPRFQASPRLRRAAWLYAGGAATLWLPIVLLALGWFGGGKLFGPVLYHPVREYVLEHTAPDDTVLVWGASSKINFQTDRRSPSRFHYGYYLIIPDEVTRRNIREFVRDLERRQPALIIDAAVNDGKRVPPLDPATRQEWEEQGGRRDVEDLSAVYAFVADHCAIETHIDLFQIYRCRY